MLQVSTRESVLGIGGQDILSREKVTLRLTATADSRVIDPRKAGGEAEHSRLALYWEARLALRAAVGTRDIILPGDIRELLNNVFESQKAAEANLITRREETATMRSQLNTARLIADNPTLMRPGELELVEKVAEGSNLNMVCGYGSISGNLMEILW